MQVQLIAKNMKFLANLWSLDQLASRIKISLKQGQNLRQLALFSFTLNDCQVQN